MLQTTSHIDTDFSSPKDAIISSLKNGVVYQIIIHMWDILAEHLNIRLKVPFIHIHHFMPKGLI